jgi:hypothetical protein
VEAAVHDVEGEQHLLSGPSLRFRAIHVNAAISETPWKKGISGDFRPLTTIKWEALDWSRYIIL